jgi:hypothetical protein
LIPAIRLTLQKLLGTLLTLNWLYKLKSTIGSSIIKRLSFIERHKHGISCVDKIFFFKELKRNISEAWWRGRPLHAVENFALERSHIANHKVLMALHAPLYKIIATDWFTDIISRSSFGLSWGAINYRDGALYSKTTTKLEGVLDTVLLAIVLAALSLRDSAKLNLLPDLLWNIKLNPYFANDLLVVDRFSFFCALRNMPLKTLTMSVFVITVDSGHECGSFVLQRFCCSIAVVPCHQWSYQCSVV